MPIGIIHGNRVKLLAYICIVLMVIFVIRLFYLQIIQHGNYVALADQGQLKRLIIPASRGEIYTLDGKKPVKMVLNETVYTVFADPSIVTQAEDIIDTVKKVAGGNARPNIQALLDKKDSRYQILATKVSKKQAELMKQKDLSGLGFQKTTQRVYPEGSLAAQTLGFVNNEGIGQYGIEGRLNAELTGKDGLLQSVTDVSNVPLTIGDRNINQPAENGKNVVLTIDRNVQSYAEQALAKGLKQSGARDGSVIVMDPQTGKIMAMANQPTYNPGKYTQVKDANAFNNTIITRPYEPGSVMKTFTVATGIDKGVITPNSTYNNTDYIKVADRTITNATKGQTGNITIQHALNWSLNTGMVTVAQRLGNGKDINRTARNTMYSYLHDRFNLGKVTGVELSGEERGIIVPPTQQEGNAVRYSNMSFGQGMDLTMVQVASGFSAIVNGGIYRYPTVIEGSIDSDGVLHEADAIKSETGVIKESTSKTVRKMVYEARKKFYSRNDKSGYYVGGKTGTSQTLDASGNYIDEQTTATYLGYGGDQKTSRYVIMVRVSGANLNLQGNIDAMPIFTDISNWLLDYMKIQPKG